MKQLDLLGTPAADEATRPAAAAPIDTAVAGDAGAAIGAIADALVDQDTEASWLAYVERQHRALGGDPRELPALIPWARRLLRAVLAGDSCVPVPVDAPLPSSPLIATAAQAGDHDGIRPLVHDMQHLYLHRLWQAECLLAARVGALDRSAPIADARRISVTLDLLTQLVRVEPEQLRAIAVALNRRLLVLTGGPGTGKTHTIAVMIAALRRARPGLRIALAAPTGKAASRLADALSRQFANLAQAAAAHGAPAPGQGASPSERGASSTGTPATGSDEGFASLDLSVPPVSTVHALLGLGGDLGGGHRPRRALDADLIVVDEASMLGLELARALVEAMPPDTRLVLAGDGEQLSSVEPGSVFADLIGAGGHALSHCVVRLLRNFRQAEAPGLSALAAALRSGDLDERMLPLTDVTLVEAEDGRDPRAAIVADAADRYLALLSQPPDPWQRLACSEGFRLLTAMREGPLGAAALSRAIDLRIGAQIGAQTGAQTGAQVDADMRIADAAISAAAARPPAGWYPGRLVIVLRNARELGLANGDIGIGCWRDGRFGVAFGGPAQRTWYSVAQLPDHEPAWALTVHKSQGSEYEEVGFVAAPAGHPLSRRELAYTAVTRAKRRITIWGGWTALGDAAARPMARRGTLAQRLAAAAADGR